MLSEETLKTIRENAIVLAAVEWQRREKEFAIEETEWTKSGYASDLYGSRRLREAARNGALAFLAIKVREYMKVEELD